jgi:hypothetical protein
MFRFFVLIFFYFGKKLYKKIHFCILRFNQNGNTFELLTLNLTNYEKTVLSSIYFAMVYRY